MARARHRQRSLAGRGPLRWALLFARAVVMCLALQMSGFLHFAVDLWLEGEAAAAHFGGQREDDDEDCPPGCPTCHCVHASPALPIQLDALAPVLLPAFEVAWAPYEARTPPPREPRSVYRPPRA